MDCPLCLDPLDPGTVTKYEHPQNGTCTGFDIHASCLASYIHNHLTQDTNLVCTTCRMDLAPFHVRDRRPRQDIDFRPAHWGPELTPQQIAERRVQLAERRVQLAQQRIEEHDALQNPFLQMPTSYVDLIHAVVGGHSLLQIIVTGGRLHHFIQFGVCTIYAYERMEPYLRRRGGTRKKGGMRKKHTARNGLKPNELAIIEVRDPTDQFINKVERMIGKKARFINYDDINELDQ